jgi:tetratricopeptide (TPR) repeat protein
MGDYKKGISFYERALQVDPNCVTAITALGGIYIERGLYKKAIESFDKALRLTPQDRDSYYWRGKAYEGLSSYREALHDFHRAIQLAPNDLDTHKEIAALLLKMGLKSEDAQATYLRKEGFNEDEIKVILQLEKH